MRAQDVINWITEVQPIVKECGSVEKGLLKFASDKNLAPSQLERLAQLVNAGSTVEYLNVKTASKSRGSSFKIIDVPALVAEYTKKEATCTKKPKPTKVVSRRFQQVDLPEGETILDKEASEEQSELLRKQAENELVKGFIELQDIRDRIIEEKYSASEKIARMFRYEDQLESYEQNEADALYVFGKEASEALDFIYKNLGKKQVFVKRATDEGPKRLVKQSDFINLVEHVSDLLVAEKAAVETHEMIEKAANAAAAPWKTKNKPNISGTGPRRQYDAINGQRELEFPTLSELNQMIYEGGVDAQHATHDFFRTYGVTPTSILRNAAPDVDNLIDSYYKNHHKERAHARNEAAYQAILTDLLMSDDLLQNEDEDVIADKYQTLISLSPDLAKDKNIARVYLRSAVQHDGMDIFSAKEHLDAQNKVISQNVERLKLSDPEKYLARSAKPQVDVHKKNQ